VLRLICPGIAHQTARPANAKQMQMPMALYERGGIVPRYRRLLMRRACVSRLQCRKPDIASHDAEWTAKLLIGRYRTVLGRLYPMSQFSK
jgi:hypothetical protein